MQSQEIIVWPGTVARTWYKKFDSFMVSQGYTRSEYDATASRYFFQTMVTKGYSQMEGIDYNDIFSPVVKLVSIRIVLALVALLYLEIEQLDVKTTFLHRDLDDDTCMEQPKGFL